MRSKLFCGLLCGVFGFAVGMAVLPLTAMASQTTLAISTAGCAVGLVVVGVLIVREMRK